MQKLSPEGGASEFYMEVAISMHRQTPLILVFIILFSRAMFAQQAELDEPTVAYWVHYWSLPPVILFGPEEEDFYKNMRVVLFPYDNHDEPTNPTVLENNIQWLKGHPNVHFYVNGYASSRGPLIYNLALSQRRADWVKDFMISRGIAENQIKLAVGWGELYPVCPERTDECWALNKRVRFRYSPQ